MARRGFGLMLALVSAGCVGTSDPPQLIRALGPSSGMVISQIYGGGGNSGAVLSHDYVELFNRGHVAVDLTGWSLQYAAATGTTWQVHPLPATAVQPGRYFLVRLGAGSSAQGDPLPATPDSEGTINLAVSSGKVALARTAVACGDATDPCSTSSALVDLVGYGSANEYEGSGAAPSPSDNNTALLRKASGCLETDDNAGDFLLGTWSSTGSLVLHDSSSPATACPALDGGAADAAVDAPIDAATPSGAVVVSQIYGGGGQGGASYAHDYIELFNRGSQTFVLGGWSVQYASAANNFSQKVDLPEGTAIAPGQYLLIQLASDGAVGSALPTPDLVGLFNLSATAGKVALVTGTTLLACGSGATLCSSPAIVDLVGYGTTASDFEGSAPAPAPSSTTNAVLRAADGCTDTDDNADDFAVGPASPRSSASPVTECSAAVPDAGLSADLALPDAALPDAALSDAGLPPTQLVAISQVYGGGGNSGAVYTHDYVELFNRGSQTAQLGGWSLQYASSLNNFSQRVELPAGSALAPGGYYLIQLAAGASGSGSALPTPDLVGAINLAATAGKVALVRSAGLLACGAATSRCSSPAIEDLVGYGASASDYEGSGPAPAPSSNAQAMLRKHGGCTDSDDNAADFAVAPPAPRNTAAQLHDCSSIVLDAGLPPDLVLPDSSPVADGPLAPDSSQATDAALTLDSSPARDTLITPDSQTAPDGAVDASPPATPSVVVISQLYGAGGNSGAKYTHDYIEIFNRSADPVSIGGWSIQYASSANTFTQKIDLPSGASLLPGGYFLAELYGGTVGASLPTADLVAGTSGAFNMSATAGKIALVRSTSLLACGSATSRCSSPTIEDLVGYGSSATDFEGAPAPAPGSAQNALLRKGGGCVDTEDNAADFASASADPRTSASPARDCNAPPADAGLPADLTLTRDLAPQPEQALTDTIVPAADLAGSDAGRDLGFFPPVGDGEGCACHAGGAGSSPEAGGLLAIVLAGVLLGLRRRSRA